LRTAVAKFRSRLVSEFLIIVLASFFPFFYMFLQNSDLDELDRNFRSFVASGFLLKYTLWMVGIYLALSVVHYYYRKDPVAMVHGVFGQVASGIINVYRLAAGVILALPLIWFLEEPETLTAAHLGLFIPFGLGCLFVSAIFSSVHEWIEIKLDKHLTKRSSAFPA